MPTIAELIRHLYSNPYLRLVCGLDAVPSAPTFSRLLRRLLKHEDLLNECIDDLVRRFAELAPGFGQSVAIDSTDVHAWSRGKKQGATDPDGSWSAKGSKEASKGRSPAEKQEGDKKKKKDKEDLYSWFVVPSISLSRLAGESPVKVGSAVIDRAGLIESISKANRKVVGVDMESYALLRATRLSDERLRAMVVKGVMDLGANKSDSVKKQAAFWAAGFLARFIAAEFDSVCLDAPST